jgi:hypothetical protein
MGVMSDVQLRELLSVCPLAVPLEDLDRAARMSGIGSLYRERNRVDRIIQCPSA